MKKLVFTLSLLLAAHVCVSGQSLQKAAPAMPGLPQFSDYTGDSFLLSWGAVEGADSYLLNVFSVGDEKESVSEDFASVRHTNDKIDTSDPGYPEGWDIDVSSHGKSDMVYDGTRDYIALDSAGDYIATPVLPGTLDRLTISAALINAEGITKDNSSVVRIEVFDDHDNRILYGDVAALYFYTMPTFDFFASLGYNTGNVAKARISLVQDGEKKVGALMVRSVDFEYGKREFVLNREATAATSYRVTGLDAEKVYYANVAARNADGESAPSEMLTVDGFLTPVAQQPSDVTATSYTARWEALPKADRYVVSNYKVTELTADGLWPVLHDDFSLATEGTRDEPVSVSSPDDYTQMKGWGGDKFIIADGMLGGDKGQMVGPRPVTGYLQTPPIDLSGDGGRYTVSVKAYGQEGDYLSLYRVGYVVGGKLNIHATKPFPASGYIEETWTMDDGADNMRISIEPKKMGRFFLDEITVSQMLPKGSVVKDRLSTDTVAAPATAKTFDGLEAGGVYGYDLTAIHYDRFGYENVSGLSNFVTVRLSPSSGIGRLATDGIRVAAAGGSVAVEAPEGLPVAVSSADGRLLARAVTHNGTTSVAVGCRGLVIVKVGSSVFKLVCE